jgi:hypothetical protein
VSESYAIGCYCPVVPPSSILLRSLHCMYDLQITPCCYSASGRILSATRRGSLPYTTQLRANSNWSVSDLFGQGGTAQNYTIAVERKGCQT